MISSCLLNDHNSGSLRFCLQRENRNSVEQRCIRFSSIKFDYQELGIKELSFSDPNAVPIGSVEFVREFAKVHGIELPTQDMSYPEQLRKYLGRSIRSGRFDEALPDEFVKPRETKIFDGGIRKQLSEIPEDLSVPCWISEPIRFTYEFRFYIHERKILGWAQYDDGVIDRIPDILTVRNMIYEYGNSQPIGYAIDLGETSSGDFLLIEVNDGWALGFYQWGRIHPEDYIALLESRWNEIKNGGSSK